MWLHAYQAVTGGAGRYVQGGGCTTVGVAGLVQGGGFGSCSKAYGTAAASLLEAEIVTADGKTRTVNATHDPDLFWALKGGGGSTFGVATRLTLATHELPSTFGAVNLTLKAHSDESFRRLLARFVDHYATNLMNPHWGEQARARPDNRLEISMVYQGLTPQEARAAWQPIIDFAHANPADYEGHDALVVLPVPARLFWSADFHRLLGSATAKFDPRPGAPRTDFWWSGNTEEAGAFWYAYTSTWMPSPLLKPDNRPKLVDAWFGASRHWGVSFHFNKGLAGASDAVIESVRNTATNPNVVNAFALAIVAADGPPAFEKMPFPDLAAARDRRTRVNSAIKILRDAAPGAGTYLNECDYFQPDWQNAFWGTNYPRLLGIKRQYDPDNLFHVHHGVGTEDWTDDGFTRTA